MAEFVDLICSGLGTSQLPGGSMGWAIAVISRSSELLDETTRLYRGHGVRVADRRSLLSAVVQLPILVGLFGAIRRGLGDGGCFLWVKNNTVPDIPLAVLCPGVTLNCGCARAEGAASRRGCTGLLGSDAAREPDRSPVQPLASGHAGWAIFGQYPHPEEQGVLLYTVVVVLTPILSIVALFRGGKRQPE